MSDLISRQAAIAVADELKDDLPDDERIADAVMAHNAGILEYQTALSLLPSAQPEILACGEGELNTQGWIPWWQEYPDNNRFVLVCNDDGRMAIAQYIGHEVDAYHLWQIAYCPYDVDVWDDDEYGKIVAWTELPAPPEEEQS